MNCNICSQNYDKLERKPYILYPCCHTYCHECLSNLKSCPHCSLSIESKKENIAFLDILNKSSSFSEHLNRIESTNQLIQLDCDSRVEAIQSKSKHLEDTISLYTNKIIDSLMFQQNELILACRQQQTEGLNQLKEFLTRKRQIDIKINEIKSNIISSGDSYTSSNSSNVDLNNIQDLIQSDLDQIKFVDFDFVFVENEDLISQTSSIGSVIKRKQLKRKSCEAGDLNPMTKKARLSILDPTECLSDKQRLLFQTQIICYKSIIKNERMPEMMLDSMIKTNEICISSTTTTTTRPLSINQTIINTSSLAAEASGFMVNNTSLPLKKSVSPLRRTNLHLEKSFTFQTDRLSEITQQILNSSIENNNKVILNKREANEIIESLFNQMKAYIPSRPSPKDYLIGIEAIFSKYPQIVINDKRDFDSDKGHFLKMIKQRYTIHRRSEKNETSESQFQPNSFSTQQIDPFNKENRL